jgi:exodeoxyribonuclease V alpha subunit
MWDSAKFNRTAPFTVPVICDESSMVDSWLMSKVLEYTPPKLILVGDAAQLPPVGKGQPFHDLVKLRPDRVSTLTTCHRAKGAVHIAAQAIRDGRPPAKRSESGDEKWLMYDTGGPEQTVPVLRSWVEKGQFDPEQDIILAPQYGSSDEAEQVDGGIHALNRTVKAILNPAQDGEKFTTGDRIIINKNFGSVDLWNGDLGTITDIDAKGMPYVILDRDKAKREDLDQPKDRLLTKEQLKEMAHAYALSVHKSQGSQFRRVFFVVFKRHHMMLSRALIYTAVTRAREGCIVMGELGSFYRGLNIIEHKNTVLQYLAQQDTWGTLKA